MLIGMVGSAFRVVGQAFRWSGWLSIGMVGLLFGMVSNNQSSFGMVSIYQHLSASIITSSVIRVIACRLSPMDVARKNKG